MRGQIRIAVGATEAPIQARVQHRDKVSLHTSLSQLSDHLNPLRRKAQRRK